MRKLLTIVVILAFLIVSVIGCTPKTPTTPVVPDPPETGPEYGGTLRLTLPNTPPGVFNDAYQTAVVDGTIINRVYSTLVRVNGVGAIEPLLATEWSYSADGLTLTFKLRDDVYFHDGVQLTAHDVEFTHRLLAHPDYTGTKGAYVNYLSGYADFKGGLTTDFPGIKVINDFEIAFTTDAVNVKQINERGMMGILPKHLLGDVAVANMINHPFNSAPIGSGPFKFKTMATDQYVELEAYEEYFEGRPYVDSLIYRIRDAEASLIELELGELDYVGINPDNLELVNEWDHVSVKFIPVTNFAFVSINLQDPRFDVLTRQALAHAINRQGIVDDVMFGTTGVIESPITPASWAYNDGLEHYDYSITRAKQLLADAGWTVGTDGILTRDGLKMEVDFAVPAGGTFVSTGSIITQNLEEIGMKVNMRVLDLPVWIQQILSRSKPYTAGQYDLGLMQIGLGTDPDMSLMFDTNGGFNFGGFYDAENDALLAAGLKALDPDERKAIYFEWQQLMRDRLPVIPLYNTVLIVVINNRVEDAWDDEIGHPFPNQFWWIPKSLQ